MAAGAAVDVVVAVLEVVLVGASRQTVLPLDVLGRTAAELS
jgi:hypothetical protein